MPSRSKSEIVRALFGAYKSKDRRLAEKILAEDFTFTSPYDDAIDRAAYFERCWPNSERIKEHALEKVVEDGDDVFVTYTCRTIDGKEFRNTELFGFAGDRVRSVEVFFGASYRNGVFLRSQ
jgi:ketosteroid isomerase-like protein